MTRGPLREPERKALMVNIGRVARAWREKLGMSRHECAHRLDLNPEYYARLERGESMPSVESLYKLATLFNISVDLLLDWPTRSRQDHEEAATTRDDVPETREWRELVHELSHASPEAVRKLKSHLEMLMGSRASSDPESKLVEAHESG